MSSSILSSIKFLNFTRCMRRLWSSLLLIKVCCDIHVVVVLFWNPDRLGLLEPAHYDEHGWVELEACL